MKPSSRYGQINQSTRIRARKSRRGMGLPGTIISIGVGALVAAGVAVEGVGLYNQMRVNDTVKLAYMLNQKTRDVFVNSSTYPSGSLMHTVITLGNLDDQAKGPSTARTLSTPFGGSISLTGAATSNFVLTFNDLPKEACAAVLNAFLNDRMLNSSSVNTVSASSLPTTPLTETIVATRCSNVSEYDVALTFK